jgi:sulfur carrier protein
MKIVVNGKDTTVNSGATVEALLRDRGLEGRPCAVEINQEVVPKREHPERTLAEGDRVELVTLVGGG